MRGNPRYLAVLLALALVPACKSAPARLADTPEARDAALQACRDAVKALDVPADQRRLGIMTTNCGAAIATRPGCREAFESLGAVAPDQRLKLVVQRCAADYCPVLPEPKPALCRDLVGDEPVAGARLLAAIGKFETERVEGAEHMARHAMLLSPIVVELPPSAEPRGLKHDASGSVVITIDNDGITVRVGTDPPVSMPKTAGGEYPWRLVYNALVAAKNAHPGWKTLSIDAQHEVPYRAIIQVMDVSRARRPKDHYDHDEVFAADSQVAGGTEMFSDVRFSVGSEE